MKIGICAGHCMQAPGAANPATNINEQWVNRLVVNAAVEQLRGANFEVVDPRSDLIVYNEITEGRSGAKWEPKDVTLFHRAGIYREESVDLILDIHMDVRSPIVSQRAYGLIFDEKSHEARAFGQSIADEVTWQLQGFVANGLSIGVSGRGTTFTQEQMGKHYYMLRATKAPAVILEICDIGPHREKDCLAIQADVAEFAQTVAAGITVGVKRVA